ncbi:MAG: enterochelin esterase-like enzyme [Psychromonas sp.]|jgi:enterochelin esterase-like enzyme|uniref:alpha/beta hydrolase-fold protein n=1 Tax=Psychromonas sp. TaxID=1884585 RepID=UPI0039E611F8
MHNQTKSLTGRIGVSAILLLAMTGCKSTIEADSPASACLQVAGTWDLIADTDDSQCGGSGKQEKMVFTVTQDHCQLENSDGTTGTINGADINWIADPWYINGGEVTYSKAIARIEGKQVTGSYDWNWSDGSNECSGTTKVNGTILANGETVSVQTKVKEKNPMLLPSEGSIAHTFSLQASDAKAVYLAGEMSDWQADVFKMKKQEQGDWSLTLYLQPGAWQYKFVVDGKWRYDHSNPKTTDDGYEGLNSLIVLGKEVAELTVNPNIAHGAVINSDFDSKVLGANSPYAVYLPAGYSADSQKIYPLLVLLHGYGNDQQQWIRDGKIQNFMDNLADKGVIEPFIIVMPSGEKSQYVGKREIHIMEELIPYVKAQYRIKPGKASTAISGLSMGGFGAFYLAHRHQDIFGLSVPLSGYFNMSNYPDFNPEKFTMTPALYLYCGSDDHTSFVSNQGLVKLLKKGGIDFTYKTAPGGHTWRYWNSISSEFLTVISDFFNQ